MVMPELPSLRLVVSVVTLLERWWVSPWPLLPLLLPVVLVVVVVPSLLLLVVVLLPLLLLL